MRRPGGNPRLILTVTDDAPDDVNADIWELERRVRELVQMRARR